MAGYANTGDADIHVLAVLFNGWNNIYKQSSAAFKKQFVGTADAELTTWFNKLTAKPIQFVLANQRATASYPEVSCWIDGETQEEHFLGTDYLYDGVYGTVFFAGTNITIELRTQGPELSRALRRIVRAMMTSARLYFVKEHNYQDVIYKGGQLIGPDEQQLAEQSGLAGITIWRLYFKVTANVFIPNPLEPEEIMTWFAQANDIVTPDGPGGIVPVPE